MTKADRVLSTPPLNSSSIQEANPPPEALAESVDSFSHQPAIGQSEGQTLTSESGKPAKGLSRRLMLGGLAMLPAALPAAAEAAADPIFAAIEACRHANAACIAVDGDIPDEIGQRWSDAEKTVMGTRPTTPSGLAALTSWVREKADWLRANHSCLLEENFCALTATIDDTARGMSGLKDWVPPALPAVGTHPDTEMFIAGGR
jgi:hypothetical protein